MARDEAPPRARPLPTRQWHPERLPAKRACGRNSATPPNIFVYDLENRLVEVRPKYPVLGNRRTRFAYDALGRRIRKWREQYVVGGAPWSVVTTPTTAEPYPDLRFVYDGGLLIAELDGLHANAVVRRYTWGLDVSQTRGGAGGIGGLLGFEYLGDPNTTTDDAAYVTLGDGAGNVTQVIDVTLDAGQPGAAFGTLAAHFEYDPYGRLVTAAGAAATRLPFGYASKYRDAETGLVDFGRRYYWPRLGRWLTRDPLGEAGGLNLYGYVGNGPDFRVDPWGLYEGILPGPKGCGNCVDVHKCEPGPIAAEGQLRQLLAFHFPVPKPLDPPIAIPLPNPTCSNTCHNPLIFSEFTEQPYPYDLTPADEYFAERFRQSFGDVPEGGMVAWRAQNAFAAMILTDVVTAGLPFAAEALGPEAMLEATGTGLGAARAGKQLDQIADAAGDAAAGGRRLASAANRSCGAPKSVKTPYGPAVQEQSAAALRVRSQIQQGGTVYKGGVLGRSETGASQFLATESPLNPGYAGRYGIPPQNAQFDFIMGGRVRPGAPVITRSAPGIPPNPGGGIEGVINSGDLMIDWFHMP